MNNGRAKIDDFSISSATSRSIEYAEFHIVKSLAYLKDEDKKKRLLNCECRYCWYFQNSRIGGRACTNWQCGVCAKQQMHSNTATPKICLDCGKKYKLCVECGGDLYQRQKKIWDIPIK